MIARVCSPPFLSSSFLFGCHICGSVDHRPSFGQCVREGEARSGLACSSATGCQGPGQSVSDPTFGGRKMWTPRAASSMDGHPLISPSLARNGKGYKVRRGLADKLSSRHQHLHLDVGLNLVATSLACTVLFGCTEHPARVYRSCAPCTTLSCIKCSRPCFPASTQVLAPPRYAKPCATYVYVCQSTFWVERS